jgi:hypothetical protein
MKSLRFCALSLGLAVSLLIAGCGGSSNNSGGNTGSNTTNPTVTSISPASVMAGSASLTLTVSGTGFTSSTSVEVGGVADQTAYVSATQLTATVPAAQLSTGAQLSVIVVNGLSSSGSGTPVNLQVTNPAPAITTVAPAVEPAGAAAPVITVTGTGFVPATVIQVNGSNRSTTFTSATQVSVALTAADVAASGSLSLTAVNPAPGGGTSTAATVAVNNPAPGVGKLSQATVLTGAMLPVTITVTGANYVPNSTVLVNGTARSTTFVSSTQLSFQLTTADLATVQQLAVSVMNPAPGGGTASAGTLWVLQSTSAPVITSVSPTQFIAGSSQSTITVYGTNLFQIVGANSYFLTATVQWNGTPLTTLGFYPLGSTPYIEAAVPASLLTAVGTANITVSSTTSTPPASNSLPVTIVNPPPPTLTSIYPSGGPINTATSITLEGTGFTSTSTVALNGITIPSTYVDAEELTATIPASSVTAPGNANLTVTTPAPGGGTTAPLSFTAYLGITNNDMVYNAADGLLYASIPGSVGGMGNSVVGIDPVTGNIQRQIFAGSNPDKLALSTDGTQLFVGLDGAGAVAQISLSSGKVVNQFTLTWAANSSSAVYTAAALAAVPGEPNSVAVAIANEGVEICDSGVARASTSSTSTYFYDATALAFASSASTLYAVAGEDVYQMTVGSTGITATTTLYTGTYYNGSLQYDSGSLYLSSGAVLNATNGALVGTFYATASNAAAGPVVSDSTLGLAFVAYAPEITGSPSVLAFNETTFDPTGSITVNDSNEGSYPYTFDKILRWGQNGLALNTPSQIYIFESPVVKDLSPSPADLAVTLTAPSTGGTGTAITYTATIKNNGPNQAQDATLTLALDSSLIVNSITPSQGTCGTGTAFDCNLGQVTNGSSVTVTVSAIPTTSGTLAGVANVTSVSYDPTTTNNQATTSTTVTGSAYSMAPVLTSISPELVQAGFTGFTLTVTGTGFNSASVVNLGNTALTTSYISSTQLTAEVDASSIANYGWAPVTVTNSSPGGGTSQVAPLTVYTIVNVPANQIVFDPFSQQIYASVPSASTTVTGNSIVTINPVTAAVGTPVAVGSEPSAMAETSDGNILYIALNGSESLVQFNLLNQSIQATLPLPASTVYPYGQFQVTSLAAMPGSDSSVAVNDYGTTGILDISGNTGAFRADYASGADPSFPDASHLYTASGSGLTRYTLNSSGATLLDTTTLNDLGSFELVQGFIYGTGGGIANASSTPPRQIATLGLQGSYETGVFVEGTTVAADPSTQKEFLIVETAESDWANSLARFSTSSYLMEDTVALPSLFNNTDANFTLLRWGQAGFALLVAPDEELSPSTTAQIMLIEGPWVTPQLLGTNTAAVLTSSSTTSVTHGAGNTLLTLTGSNFAPGVAVTWNGSYRTTTIVDAAHVTVAIPAGDLAAAGSGSLVATNPGGPASNTLTVTIN